MTTALTEQVTKLCGEAYLHESQMPYHGSPHPDQVRSAAEKLVEGCKLRGIAVDEEALFTAIKLHDAWMHINPKLLNFRTPEDLAATFGYNLMIQLGQPENFARKVENIIRASNHAVLPRTTEEIIMRAADLWTVGQDFETFAANSLALHREAELRQGKEIPLAEWTPRGFGYLGLYLWPMLELTPGARDIGGRSVWHKAALANMTRFWRERSAPEGVVVAEVVSEANPTITFTPSNAPTFFVALSSSEQWRESNVHKLPPLLSPRSVACTIPGDTTAMSLPDGCCDQIILHELTDHGAREAHRVLKPGASLIAPLTEEARSKGDIRLEGYLFDHLVQRGSTLYGAFFRSPA